MTLIEKEIEQHRQQNIRLKEDLNKALQKLLKTETKLIRAKVVGQEVYSLKQELENLRLHPNSFSDRD